MTTSPVAPSRTAVREPDVPAWLLGPEVVRRPVVPTTPARASVPPRHDDAPTMLPSLDDYEVPPLPEPAAAVRREPRVAFRPDVEGLRGLAVLLVVLYHAGLPWLPGGFVGVDAFFVVSGYVITSLLVAEVREHRGVSLAGFYARRARRILPAAAFVLVLTCVAGAVLLPPLARLDLARDVLASALYSGNWSFIAEQTDYLRAGGAPSPVLHYWSLGVEEQFYLLWPFVFVGALVVARRRGLARTTVLAAALTVLTAVSFALSLRWTQTSEPLAYLSSPSRGWQFAVGAWLALLLPVAARLRGRTATAVRVVLGVVGLVVLVGSAVRLGENGYPGTLALVPTLATAALVAAGCDVPASRGHGVTRLLSLAPVRRLGAWSFTWYLWHWPVIVLVAARWGDLDWPVRCAVAVGSLVPAALTSRWVERPVRRSAVVASRPRVGLALGVAATVVPVLAASGLAALTLSGATVGAPAAGRIDRKVVSFDDALTSGPVTPTVFEASRDVHELVLDCQAGLTDRDVRPCSTGPAGPDGPVVLFGDSHASQWMSAVEDLATARRTSVTLLAHSGCPAARITVPGRPEVARACDAWREAALRQLETGPRPALVVVSGYNGYLRGADERSQAWAPTLRRLVALGAPVVYLVDTPYPDRDVPTCISAAPSDWSACSFPRRDALRQDLTAQQVAAGRWPGVVMVDLVDFVCPPSRDRCPAVRGGVLLYRDASHLTDTAVQVLAPQFVAAVQAQLP